MTRHTDAPIDRIRDVLGACSISPGGLRCFVLAKNARLWYISSVQILSSHTLLSVDDPVAVTPSSHTRLGLAEVFSWDMVLTLTVEVYIL